jgi:hypothetical protein
MPVLSTGQLTLVDVAKRTNPDGSVARDIAELLSQQNDILEDVVWRPTNEVTAHTETIRTGLPSVYWRAYNQGVPRSKSTTAQVKEPVGMAEARNAIDAKLLELNGNSAAWRLTEDSPFVEAMGQEMAGKMFNGNVGVDGKSFSGLATRYSSTSAGNGNNVLLAGGSGADNASIYLVGWGESTVFGIYPKNSTAGLVYKDLGITDVIDANNNEYQAAKSLYQWDAGLVVKDWRYGLRIANIDMSDWLGVTGTQAWTSATHVLKLMVRALARIPNKNSCRLAFYCNRSVAEGLMVQAMDRSSSAVMSIQDSVNQFGQDVKQLMVLGVPVRIVDQLGIAETLVS